MTGNSEQETGSPAELPALVEHKDVIFKIIVPLVHLMFGPKCRLRQQLRGELS
ncbi:hypothetical protein [Kaarinaea lacus]